MNKDSLKLWIFVVFAFLILIGAWSVLIVVATRNQPESIELAPQRSDEGSTVNAFPNPEP